MTLKKTMRTFAVVESLPNYSNLAQKNAPLNLESFKIPFNELFVSEKNSSLEKNNSIINFSTINAPWNKYSIQHMTKNQINEFFDLLLEPNYFDYLYFNELTFEQKKKKRLNYLDKSFKNLFTILEQINKLIKTINLITNNLVILLIY